MNLIRKIFSIYNERGHKIVRILGLKLSFKKSVDLKLIEQRINTKINKLDEINYTRLARINPKPYLTNFVIDITHHCNLNCKGCDHFSPLAEEGYYDLEQFKKDIKRISELTNGRIDRIGIMGGEPLLNPNCIEYLKISRQYLPNTKIRLVTNGILLTKQSEIFWQKLKELNIYVEYTKYDINLDYNKIDEIVKKYQVHVEVYGYNQNVVKTSHKIPLDLNGNQDVVYNFLNCFHGNHCITLKNGKIYTCTVAPNIEHFNKYFDKDIPLSDYDGIDIYKVNNIQEILQFLAKPIPFCRFCNVKGRTFGHKWGISKKDISEWT